MYIIYDLFNDTVIGSNYIAPDGRMNWKGYWRKSWPNLRYYSIICMGRLRTTMKNLRIVSLRMRFEPRTPWIWIRIVSYLSTTFSISRQGKNTYWRACFRTASGGDHLDLSNARNGPVYAGIPYQNFFLFLNFIQALINTHYIHLYFSNGISLFCF
jgi:hypothetical protein